jgi:hypothetical protein
MKFRPILQVSLGLVIAGCAFRTSPPTQLYVLPSAPVESRPALVQETLGLLPIRLPRYLDRPQIVTVEPDGQVHAAEFHRWAEPLAAGVSRLLAEGLSARLQAQVVLLPASLPVERTLEIQVRDFKVSQGQCLLAVAWRIKGSNPPSAWHRQTLLQPVQGEGYSAIVAAMGKAVDQLAEYIAEQLR